MPHVIRALAAAVTALILAATLLAAPAHAGTCTKVGPVTLCGKVTLLTGSSRSMAVGNGWNGTCLGKKYLRPGETSTRFFRDADCYEIPSGHHGHVGTLCYKAGKDVKVYDGQHIRVSLRRGSSC